MIPVTGVSETELAGENWLSDVALDLKNLWTTLRFAVELKDKSRIRFGFNIQVKLSRGGFGLIIESNPAIVEDDGVGLSSREIQGDGEFTQEPAGVKAAGGGGAASVDGNLEAEFGGEDGFSGELVEVGHGEVERGGDGLDMGVREVRIGRNEGNECGLRREILEGDSTETWGRRRVNQRASRFGS